MKFRTVIISLCFLLTGNLSLSQSCESQRYRDSIFGVVKTPDIIFANVQSIPAVYVSENVTVSQNLFMDIFEPAGDTLLKRPLIIFAFGGGFLIGGKDDEDAQTYCDSMAHTGYVTASIDYRLGMNIASPESAVRAIYRAAQDYSAAVRYLKEYSEQYRIDTNFIFTGGVSAGSFSAMNLAYMQEANRPLETFASGGLTPAPDLGCLHCSGNSYNHNTKAKALLNCWGALLDTSWMELNDNTPLISFHGTADPIVPYATGFPFTALFLMPEVHGSEPITERANNIGLTNQFHPFAGQGHNVWGTVVNHSFVGGQTPYFDSIFQETKAFFYPFLQPAVPVISGSVSVCVGDTVVYSVVQNQGSTYCWEVQGGSILSPNVQQNQITVVWQIAGSGSVKAIEINHLQASSDATVYNVNIEDCVTAINPVADNNEFAIFPNPVKQGCEIQLSLPAAGITRINVTDVLGKLIFIENTGLLKTAQMEKGLYVLTFYNNQQIIHRTKLIVE
ncbi:MAG: alpha/beta hydrolase fold domain-containing protein [Bacteroidia bacterium]